MTRSAHLSIERLTRSMEPLVCSEQASVLAPNIKQLNASVAAAMSSAGAPNIKQLNASVAAAMSSAGAPNIKQLNASVAAMSSALAPNIKQLNASVAAAMSSAGAPNIKQLNASVAAAMSSAGAPNIKQLNASVAAMSSALAPNIKQFQRLGHDGARASQLAPPSALVAHDLAAHAVPSVAAEDSVGDQGYHRSMPAAAAVGRDERCGREQRSNRSPPPTACKQRP